MAITSLKAQLDHVIFVVSDIYCTLRILKIQLFTAVVCIVLFLIPGQILEIYRLLSEEFFNRWPQAIMAILGVGFLTFMLWYSARWMTLNSMLTDFNASTLRSALAKWLPRLFATGMAIGTSLLFTPGSVGVLLQDDGEFWIRMTGLIILLMTVFFFLFTILGTRIGGKVGWPHQCNYITGYVGHDVNVDDSLNHDNDCIMRFIQIELDGGVPPTVQMPNWQNLNQ